MKETKEKAEKIINGLDEIIELAHKTNSQVETDVQESLDNFICHVVKSGNYRYSQNSEEERNLALYDLSRILLNEEEHLQEERVQLLSDILECKLIQI